MSPCLIRRSVLLSILMTLPALAHDPAADMSAAANAWLASLDNARREQAEFDFSDTERLNWGFVPKPRKGLPFKEMTPAQNRLGLALLNSGLSHRGFFQASTIMSLEEVLKKLENDNPGRDPELYYVSIFGKPGGTNTWAWRVEGHHLSLNFTICRGEVVANAPSFFGSNPAEVPPGSRQGLRVLGEEEDLAREFVKALTESQRKTAIIEKVAFREILTGDSRKVLPLTPAGLSFSQMNREQQATLQGLVRTYAERFRPELAKQDIGKIERAGWDKVSFAWAGGIEKGQGHYYRVQGPTFVLEYDNTQNRANHIHTAWRDFMNDFGEDALKKHYQSGHPASGADGQHE
jgi:hypothetical protein